MAERPTSRGRPRARRPRAALDTPRETRLALVAPSVDPEAFGRASERFARFMGTARFLVYMTAVVALWLAWNTYGPVAWRFDPKSLNYTLLTLILSLQASYAAPLILLAQNRQADRDRVATEQDRSQNERALADTEYLTREVAALRIAMRDIATRDFVRSELRALLDELTEPAGAEEDLSEPSESGRSRAERKSERRPAERKADRKTSDRKTSDRKASDRKTSHRPADHPPPDRPPPDHPPPDHSPPADDRGPAAIPHVDGGPADT